MSTSFLFGIPSTTYAANKSSLYSRSNSNMTGGILSLQYKIAGRFGIEAGVSQQTMHLRLQDKQFAARNPGFEVRIKSNNAYWSYYGGLTYTQPISPKSGLYFSLGYVMQSNGGGPLSETRNFIVSGEDVTLSNTYQDKSTSVYGEFGIQSMISKKVALFAGIRLNHGLTIMYQGNFTSVRDGVSLGQE